jgi:predicted permease
MSSTSGAAHHWLWLEQLVHDVRYAWRGLWRSRAFTATTVLTLAVGLGLVTIVFTIFDAYVLRPFAVRDPYSLHVIGWESRDARQWRFSWREFLELRGRTDVFDDVSAERTHFVTSGGRQLAAGFVSGNYFDMLGARMSKGRPLTELDVKAPGASPVAVLSDRAWARLYDRDPGAIGRTIELNREPLVIVGVMGPEFSGLDDSPRDVWVPVTMYRAVAKQDLFGAVQPREVVLTGRLRSGVAAAQAQSALTPFMSAISGRSDAVHASLELKATPAPLSLELVALLSPVFAAFGLVLVAACANVSNVMLARANARHREIGVRLSLGASRGRVVRQLLTEGFMIAGLAGLAGLGLAALALRVGLSLFLAMLPSSIAALIRVAPLDFDYRVFLFSLVVSGGATLMFALLPALQATRVTLTHALRGQPGASLRSSTLRNLLVTSQVTVSVVILIAAATLVRNGMALDEINLGLATDGVMSVNQRARGASLISSAAAVLAADSAVDQVAVTGGNPLFEQSGQALVTPSDATASVATRYTFVSPEYFPILRIPIVRGRAFRADEAATEARVGIVSAATARAFWPGADPIGKTVRIERSGNEPVDRLPASGNVVIVGVARDVVSGFVYDGVDRAHLYLPTNAGGAHASALLVRARAPTEFRREILPGLLQRVHADPFAFEALPLAEVLALQVFPLRIASWIGALLGAIAMALSISGLYGVLMFMLSQRTREIGIRMALGATSARVLRLVMRQCARLAAVGMTLGVVLAFVAMRLFSSAIEMRNVTIVDAGAFAAAVALVTAAAALAAYVPARRATRIAPSQALRADG